MSHVTLRGGRPRGVAPTAFYVELPITARMNNHISIPVPQRIEKQAPFCNYWVYHIASILERIVKKVTQRKAQYVDKRRTAHLPRCDHRAPDR